MSKYWREWHAARKRGHSPSSARREATWYAREWYHRMKQVSVKMAKETVVYDS